MFVDFFIQRPIFAIVCSLVIILAGAVCIPTLPIAQYPQIAAPQVTVTATYIGASAQVVESAVTTPLEQVINGVEGMRYISSTSTNSGVSTIVTTFNLDKNIDIAAVDVQNRVSTAQGRLPQEVTTTGVSITKNSSAILLAIGFYCQNNKYDNIFISNYADRFIKDDLKRVKGVGDVTLVGERKYAMRLWVDPNRLAARRLTATDVVNALKEQNIQVAAGQVGLPPSSADQAYQFSVSAAGRLKTPQEFENVILKASSNGTLVRLRDVGRAELGRRIIPALCALTASRVLVFWSISCLTPTRWRPIAWSSRRCSI